MDFSTNSQSETSTSLYNEVEVELQPYLDNPTMDMKPIAFWSDRKETDLSKLALQLLSVPSSSAPVERLFSKAGILLSQRRTRINSVRLEQLLFLSELFHSLHEIKIQSR